MSVLNEKLEEILEEKNSKIIPANIKKNIQIFDVIGTYEGDSTNIDITIGNGEYGLENAASGELDNDIGIKLFTTANTKSKLYEVGSIIEMHITNEMLASILGITADKIKAGEVILGIEGTYTGEAEIIEEE